MSTRIYHRLVLLAAMTAGALGPFAARAREPEYVLDVMDDWEEVYRPALKALRECVTDPGAAPREGRWEAICADVLRKAEQAMLLNDNMHSPLRRLISEEEWAAADIYLQSQKNAWQCIEHDGDQIIELRDEIRGMTKRLRDQHAVIRTKPAAYRDDAVQLNVIYLGYKKAKQQYDQEVKSGIRGADTAKLTDIDDEIQATKDECFFSWFDALTYALAKESAELLKFNQQYSPSALRGRTDAVVAIIIFGAGDIMNPSLLDTFEAEEAAWDTALKAYRNEYEQAYAAYEKDAGVLTSGSFLNMFECFKDMGQEGDYEHWVIKARALYDEINRIQAAIGYELKRRGVTP